MQKWQERLNGDPIPWLMESNPWTKYRTATDLLEIKDGKALEGIRKEMLSDAAIQELIKQTSDWLPDISKRNSDPKLSYFKLRMLSDFGVRADDPGMDCILKKAMEHQAGDMFAVHGDLPIKRNGQETEPEDPWNISPCNSPIVLLGLLASGCRDARIDKALALLREHWSTPEGWFCHFFFVEGQHKKVHQGCPMAGIMALDVFSRVPELKESVVAQNAFVTVEFHKQYGQTLYYFGRSKKFFTLKYPFTWYNALYLADVLTRFDFLKGNPLVEELIQWILASQDEHGRFTPSSIYMEYKGWEFANKKAPSPWITLLCCRILKRWFA